MGGNCCKKGHSRKHSFDSTRKASSTTIHPSTRGSNAEVHSHYHPETGTHVHVHFPHRRKKKRGKRKRSKTPKRKRKSSTPSAQSPGRTPPRAHSEKRSAPQTRAMSASRRTSRTSYVTPAPTAHGVVPSHTTTVVAHDQPGKTGSRQSLPTVAFAGGGTSCGGVPASAAHSAHEVLEHQAGPHKIVVAAGPVEQDTDHLGDDCQMGGSGARSKRAQRKASGSRTGGFTVNRRHFGQRSAPPASTCGCPPCPGPSQKTRQPYTGGAHPFQGCQWDCPCSYQSEESQAHTYRCQRDRFSKYDGTSDKRGCDDPCKQKKPSLPTTRGCRCCPHNNARSICGKQKHERKPCS